MEFAIAIPQTYSDPVCIQRFLRRAEELPLVAAWCLEQVIGTAPVLESVTTLAWCCYAWALRFYLLLNATLLTLRNRCHPWMCCRTAGSLLAWA